MHSFLFQLNPLFAIKTLAFSNYFFTSKSKKGLNKVHNKPTNIMGIKFPNPIGLSAGIDPNADYINNLKNFGFGFIEVGTITPSAQSIYEFPKVIRLSKIYGLINKTNFTNKGVEYLYNNLQRIQYNGVLGINICKNNFCGLSEIIC